MVGRIAARARRGKAAVSAVVVVAVVGLAVYFLTRANGESEASPPSATVAVRAETVSEPSVTSPPAGASAAPAEPAPTTRPDGPLSIYDLASDNLEEVLDDYRMPLELANDTSKRLIAVTAGVPAKVDRVVQLHRVYRQHINRLTSDERTWKFWQRLETGTGFKDSTIGRDWSVVKLDNMGFIQALEQVLVGGAVFGRLIYINNRIAEVRVTLVGGRTTWGHRRFIESTDLWATQTIERLQQDIKMMAELEQRCLREGL